MSVAVESTRASTSSTSRARSITPSRAGFSSPRFAVRSLSPSKRLDSRSSVDSVLAGQDAASSDESESDRSTGSIKKIQQRLPEPFYPPSLCKAKTVEGGRAVIQGLPSVPSEPQVNTIDEQDISTPDKWVPRDSRLVRLTGKHPFNCEARIADLFDAGFLTPSNLFYVRSHGACPKVSQEEGMNWKIDFCGLVDNACKLSIQDLVDKFEVVTLPVTLVCAGNRRKEQNMIQKGLGFSWGAGGVSTALFTGVYLSDVLDYLKPKRGAKHVIFEGADMLPKGYYGTSQRLSWAGDKDKGMLLCWAMNGLPLEPDHGYPIRVVIPGQIGGRSVKWLQKVEISDKESQHYLHFWDNKVLPTEVTPDQARKEEHWWYDPRYLITDLNVNSAIACPNHDEVLNCGEDALDKTYDIKGYAYGGGGRRITRVEISIDNGASWKLAEIDYYEDLYRRIAQADPVYGKLDLTDRDTSYCWAFWKYTVPIASLKASSVIMVRGMDEGLNLQPSDMYWNATGMMNNWYFRVAVYHLEGGRQMRFEHPTMAGTQPGGWMPRMIEEGRDALHPVFVAEAKQPVAEQKAKPAAIDMRKEGVTRMITMKELEEHNKEEEPWFAVHGEVYDGTAFLKGHPGGPESITLVAGEDATTEFMSIHSSDAKIQLRDYHIGTLVVEDSAKASDVPKTTEVAEIDATFLHKKKWKAAKLESISPISHDSRIFRFALESPEQTLGLPIGQHVFVRLRRKVKPGSDDAVVEGELVQRAYTPVSYSDAKGHIDLLIKLYLPSTTFPLGGKMSGGFHELEVGDTVELRGPIGSFEYIGKGKTKHRAGEGVIRKFGLICGGSGITPILQVLRGILQDDSDQLTEVWVLNANKSFDDILCREELHLLEAKHNGRFKLHHTLSADLPQDWKYSKGRINDDMLKNNLPEPAEDALLAICGPDAMIHDTVKPALARLGWNVEQQLHVF